MPKKYILPDSCNKCEYKKNTRCETMIYPVGNCFADKKEKDKREKAVEVYGFKNLKIKE